ncbi:phenylacetate--CoA ligase family protein [Fimbriimonadia bacterium ATM]|nr:MAG: phenylacetate--CoA ligase family protein [Armatimonadota bacterium]MBC6969148.1 phenylacetate--CoA ligase family protein [Armatimonadota bacterium]MCE7900409.1 phenylacetate--CoA ligase family protein [Armatimonadetes bacterium ATM1]MDL1928300.1 phenylacetate--CoA ligase family protein [Fimbriimonadia bacterium ATM]RIJ97634.1 MAG: hypothetical protein DCC45_02770 [Armatimonadota bacterium]
MVRAANVEEFLREFDTGSVDPGASALRREVLSFGESQWLSRDEIRERQLEKVRRVVRHASKHSSLCASLYGGERRIGDWDDFFALPVMPRDSVAKLSQEAHLAPAAVPEDAIHHWASTSGTSGRVVRSAVTSRMLRIGMANRIRELQWHSVDPRSPIAELTGPSTGNPDAWQPFDGGLILKGWGGPMIRGLLRTGSMFKFDTSDDLGSVAERLRKHGVEQVMTTPTYAWTMRNRLGPNRWKNLQYRGEVVYPEIDACNLQFVADYTWDVYGTNEVGHIATSCPEGTVHHCIDECVLVEVVREDGEPSDVGEPGRVLLTDLRNFVTPFIRYEIGDIAVRGACTCGRGLSALERIEGREIARLKTEEGPRVAASVVQTIHRLAGLQLFRLRQTSLSEFVLTVVMDREWTEEDGMKVQTAISKLIGEPASLRVERVDNIKPHPSGKREKVFVEC